ncbi:zinc-binding domain-containing protein [Rhexocercosporidium sp. MPI-PUGE-AT-0058]|nr:zinc-binding domain-containing protein [Rhexocercosporidium sp. MPI-PUGE-AT-0058]
MTRRKSERNKPQPSPWSMFPSLHDNVSRLLEAEGHSLTFHTVDNDIADNRANNNNNNVINPIKSYDTSIMGRFRCNNRECQTQVWTSKKIAITIRMYPGSRYNARVYHQRCHACNALSRPALDDSYAERVAYRLLKWRGVEQEQPAFTGGSKGPHQNELCEGCKAGRCREGGVTSNGNEGSRIDGLLDQFSTLSLVRAQTSRAFGDGEVRRSRVSRRGV